MTTTWAPDNAACVPKESQPQPTIMERLKLTEDALVNMREMTEDAIVNVRNELRLQREMVEELYRRIG